VTLNFNCLLVTEKLLFFLGTDITLLQCTGNWL